LISPSGHRKLAWDILVGTVIFYSIIEVPFRIAFQPSKSDNIGFLDTIVEGLFFVDILVTFNTAFVDPVTNFLIADRRLIALKYASFWLWIDSLSTIPFDEILIAVSGHDAAHNLSAVRLSRILRLFRLTKLLRLLGSASMKEFLDKYMISPALISIATLLLQIFVIAHIICCFWFFISTPDVTGLNNYDADMVLNTWVKSFNFQDSDIKTQYIASLYWAFATMLTVGYGDIYPTNSGERLYALCTMLLGSVVFGAIISKVRVLVESRNLQLKELKVDVAEFKSYLEERRIPNSLRAEAKVSIKVSLCYLEFIVD
jgi:Ion transport protein